MKKKEEQSLKLQRIYHYYYINKYAFSQQNHSSQITINNHDTLCKKKTEPINNSQVAF